jgi:hypothetical protein
VASTQSSERPCLSCMRLASAPATFSLYCSHSDAFPHTLHVARVLLLTCYCAPTPAARVLLLACCCTSTHASERLHLLLACCCAPTPAAAYGHGDHPRTRRPPSPANENICIMKLLRQNTSEIGETFET